MVSSLMRPELSHGSGTAFPCRNPTTTTSGRTFTKMCVPKSFWKTLRAQRAPEDDVRSRLELSTACG